MSHSSFRALEFMPVDVVEQQDIPDAIEQVLIGSLPAFITHQSTTNRRWMPGYQADFLRRGFYKAGELSFTVDPEHAADIGWHNDGAPTPDQPVHIVHDHLTVAGRGIARFLVPHPHTDIPFAQRLAAIEHIKQGHADTEIFALPGLMTELQPGSRLFFAARGRQPIAHSFRTTESPRQTDLRTYRKKTH